MNTQVNARTSPLVRVPEAARQLSISERHLWTKIKQHPDKIPIVRIGRSVRLRRETVEALARDGI